MEITPYVPTEYSIVKTESNTYRLPPIRSAETASK
jgi:hypothetical protein